MRGLLVVTRGCLCLSMTWFLWLGCSVPADEESGMPERIVVVGIDTLRADHVSGWGSDRDTAVGVPDGLSKGFGIVSVNSLAHKAPPNRSLLLNVQMNEPRTLLKTAHHLLSQSRRRHETAASARVYRRPAL